MLRLTAAGLAAAGGTANSDADTASGPEEAGANAPTPTASDGAGDSGGADRDAGAGADASPAPVVTPFTGPTLDAGAGPGGKLGLVLAAVRDERGATLAQLGALTGWQPHTLRAALTRLRQRGFAVHASGQAGYRAYYLGPDRKSVALRGPQP